LWGLGGGWAGGFGGGWFFWLVGVWCGGGVLCCVWWVCGVVCLFAERRRRSPRLATRRLGTRRPPPGVDQERRSRVTPAMVTRIATSDSTAAHGARLIARSIRNALLFPLRERVPQGFPAPRTSCLTRPPTRRPPSVGVPVPSTARWVRPVRRDGAPHPKHRKLHAPASAITRRVRTRNTHPGCEPPRAPAHVETAPRPRSVHRWQERDGDPQGCWGFPLIKFVCSSRRSSPSVRCSKKSVPSAWAQQIVDLGCFSEKLTAAGSTGDRDLSRAAGISRRARRDQNPAQSDRARSFDLAHDEAGDENARDRRNKTSTPRNPAGNTVGAKWNTTITPRPATAIARSPSSPPDIFCFYTQKTGPVRTPAPELSVAASARPVRPTYTAGGCAPSPPPVLWVWWGCCWGCRRFGGRGGRIARTVRRPLPTRLHRARTAASSAQ